MIANAYGQYILDEAYWLNTSYFRGAPLIVYSDNLTSLTDPRWTIIDETMGVSTHLNAPMIGKATVESDDPLIDVLRSYQRFFDIPRCAAVLSMHQSSWPWTARTRC